MYEGSMDEDATHVLPTEGPDLERGIAVVDGMVILHKMQSTALGTNVELSNSFNDLLLSMRSSLFVTRTRMCLCNI